MEDSRTPLLTWFWSAYLVVTSTPGISARQLRRQLEIPRYETAYHILQKLRAAMVRPNRGRIGNFQPGPNDYVEADEAYFDPEGNVTMMGAIEVRWRQRGSPPVKSIRARHAGRLRLAVGNRTTPVIERFIEGAVAPGAVIYTDGGEGYRWLSNLGYQHVPVVIGGSGYAAGFYLKMIHLVFGNLRAWLNGTHHGVRECHLQGYLNEFAFRFNRRYHPLNAFSTLLGIASSITGPTYDGIYSGTWHHTKCG